MTATPIRAAPPRKPDGYVDGFGADRGSFKVKPRVVKADRSKKALANAPTQQKEKTTTR